MFFFQKFPIVQESLELMALDFCIKFLFELNNIKFNSGVE